MKQAEEVRHISHLPVKELHLSNSHCKDKHLALVNCMHSINKLDISNNHDVTAAGLQKLSTLMSITDINISWCRIDDACLTAVSTYITSLIKLNVSCNSSFSPPGLSKLGNLSNLQSLQMNGCCGVTCEVIHALSRLAFLKELDISACDITDQCLTAMSELATLKQLKISYNPCITSEGILVLCSIPLVELHVFSCNINDDTLQVLSQMTSLQMLNVGGNDRITSSGFHELNKLSKLQCLHMSKCQGVTSTSIEFISSMALTELNMSDCKLNYECLIAVSAITSLKKLNISNNKHGNWRCDALITPAGIRAISILHLVELDASNCKLGNESVQCISPITSLKKLSLKSNDITADCLHHLSSLEHLQHLNISFCRDLTPSDLVCISHIAHIECY